MKFEVKDKILEFNTLQRGQGRTYLSAIPSGEFGGRVDPIKLSLTYLRELEVAELTEEDMPMVCG